MGCSNGDFVTVGSFMLYDDEEWNV